MKRIDISLLFSAILITFFGLFMIYDVSSYVAFRDFADKYHYVKDQAVWVALGFVGLIFFSNFNYHRLSFLALPIIIAALVLLISVFIPGIGVNVLGANRWIDTGIFILQPAEFVKLALAIYLAAWFSNKERGRLFAFLLLLGLVLFLVAMEPDMGTGIVILAEALSIYFLSGGRILYFVILGPLLFLGGLAFVKISPYRMKRLEAFLNINESLFEFFQSPRGLSCPASKTVANAQV